MDVQFEWNKIDLQLKINWLLTPWNAEEWVNNSTNILNNTKLYNFFWHNRYSDACVKTINVTQLQVLRPKTFKTGEAILALRGDNCMLLAHRP